MRQIISTMSFFIFILLFSNCRNNPTSNDNSAKKYVDSVNLDREKFEKKIKDSLSQVAWGDTKFGMSLAETKASNTFRKGKVEGDIIFVSSDSTIIGGHKFSSIYADFYKDKLYIIRIHSEMKTLDAFDDLIKEVEVLRSKINLKYGKPTFTEKDTEYISKQLMDENNVTLFKWEIDTKRIDIRIEHEFDNYFSVNCIIYDNILMKQKINKNSPKEIDSGGF